MPDQATPANEERSPSDAVRRAGMLGLLGWLLVGASVATVLIGTRTANRPHEVRGEWLATLLLWVHALVALLVLGSLVAVVRARRGIEWRASYLLPLLLAVGYAAFALYVFGRVARVHLGQFLKT